MQLVIFFPHTTREAVITRWQIIILSLPAALKYFIIFILFCLVVLLWEPVNIEGFSILADTEYWLPFVLEQLPWVAAPFLILAFVFIIRGAFAQKSANMPTRYGFDEQGIYIYNALGALMLTWTSLTSVKETRSFFLFRDATQTFLWPKAPWPPEELAELRTLYKQARAKGKSVQS